MAGQYTLGKSINRSGDPRGMTGYIAETAKKYGIDPKVALKVAKSEGLGTFQSSVPKTGKGSYNGREDSWGAFQLYKGGGLGNAFQKATGLDPADPANEKATIDFALKHAAQNGWGSWYGAKNTGIGNWEGIGTVSAETPADPTPNVGGGEESYRMPAPADPTPNVGSGEGDYPPTQGALADAVAPPSQKTNYGDAASEALKGLGSIYGAGAARNAGGSGPAAVPTATALPPQGPFPTVDPKVAEAQRQQLAVALQRLNSGKLV